MPYVLGEVELTMGRVADKPITDVVYLNADEVDQFIKNAEQHILHAMTAGEGLLMAAFRQYLRTAFQLGRAYQLAEDFPCADMCSCTHAPEQHRGYGCTVCIDKHEPHMGLTCRWDGRKK